MQEKTQTFVILVLMMLMSLGLSAKAAEIKTLDAEGEALPSYVVVIGDDIDVEETIRMMPDSVYYSIAGQTIFRVNRTELNSKDAFLRELVEEVAPWANAGDYRLVGVDLRGAASPEGPYWNNVRLSKGRAEALIDFLRSYVDSVDVVHINTVTIAEDYALLLSRLEEAVDPAAPLVRDVISRHTLENPAAIKRELRAAEGSTLWPRLLREYYPWLRAARIVLYFRDTKSHLRRLDVYLTEEKAPTLRLEPTPVDPTLRFTVPERWERRHVLAVSSNLLYDAFYMPGYGWAPMPNLQLEYFPAGSRYTFEAGFLFPYYHRWSRQQFFQIRDYHLEVRRYFSPGKHHSGAYLAGYLNANKYGIGLSGQKGWQGEGFGGALKFGYVVDLGRRWRLDFHIAGGYYTTRFDPYVYGNPITGVIDGYYYYKVTDVKNFRRRNHTLKWIGPTEVGISICFDIITRRVRR